MPKKQKVTESPVVAIQTPANNVPGFDQLPNTALLRQAQLVRSATNPIAPLPFSAPTLWRMVKAGTFPAPIKLSAKVTAWQVGAVRAWMVRAGAVGGPA